MPVYSHSRLETFETCALKYKFRYIEKAETKSLGRALAARILDEAKAMHVDRIDLEVLPTNPGAAVFWRKMGFSTAGRTVWSKEFG